MSEPSLTNSLDSLIGNEALKSYLKRAVRKGQMGNSLLFFGPRGVGKFHFAKALAEELLSSGGAKRSAHPDLHIYRPEGKSGLHSIEALRHLGKEVFLAPHEAKNKVFIIDDADRMLSYSANALLKTFEEPAEDALILLIAESPQRLLPTVRSRCRQCAFRPIPEPLLFEFLTERRSAPQKEAEAAARLARGSLGRALQLVEEGENSLEKKLLLTLSQGGFSSYGALRRFAQELQKTLDERRKRAEEEAKRELDSWGLSAAQREAFEKEIEGVQAVDFFREADILFETLLFWFRDLLLIDQGAPSSLLLYPEFEGELKAWGKRALSLELAERAVAEARLGLERHLPFASLLEALFLKLRACSF